MPQGQTPNQTGAAQRLIIPWFAVGFLGMVVFNSVVTLPESVHQTLVMTGQIALAMAMAALGYETRLEKLRALGLKPFLLALILFCLLLGGGLLVTPLLMG